MGLEFHVYYLFDTATNHSLFGQNIWESGGMLPWMVFQERQVQLASANGAFEYIEDSEDDEPLNIQILLNLMKLNIKKKPKTKKLKMKKLKMKKPIKDLQI